jgi:hypothetical protein
MNRAERELVVINEQQSRGALYEVSKWKPFSFSEDYLLLSMFE